MPSFRAGSRANAAEARMRKIFMTGFSACIRLVPAAVSTGIGSQIRQPLGDLEQYPLLAERVGCSARTKVSPRSGAVLTLGAIARSFARRHTDYTREHTQAGAGAIRSS